MPNGGGYLGGGFRASPAKAETRLVASPSDIPVFYVSKDYWDGAVLLGLIDFFGFENGNTARMIPVSADCYACHKEHGAVDTTFVQFYPTLLPIAKSKGTAASGYRR